ncbi:MAG: OadG family protein [Lachnospiraceae bacterium]|jgi:sodium pump decarboxylase gamma subunit|nr:OadG family protein [Lachnospiraceae bacterium]
MKRKLLVMGVAVISMLSISACGAVTTPEDTYGEYTAEQMQASAEDTLSYLLGLDQAAALENAELAVSRKEDPSSVTTDLYDQWNVVTKEGSEGTIASELYTEWAKVFDEAGNYVSTYEGYYDEKSNDKGFQATKSGKTVTGVLTMKFEKRDVALTYVYNVRNMEVTAINVAPVYTDDELMAGAGVNVLMGMGTVFSILILISLCIYAFNIIPYLQNKKKAKKQAETTEAPKAAVAASAPASVDVSDDAELIAVIAAAIAASTGASTDDFVVRSIKRRF